MNEQQTAPGFDKDMQEIFASYLIETREILELLCQDLLALEKNPADTNLLNDIFRGMHTIKGTSSFLGFSQMAELTHTCEDLLNKLRKGDIVADRKIIDVLIEAHKIAGLLLQRIESRNSQPMDLGSIIEELQEAMSPRTGEARADAGPSPKKERAVPSKESAEIVPQHAADSTIRVDIGKLDNLMNLVGELVLARNRLSQATQALVEKYERIEMSKQIEEINDQIDFVTTELQMAVMKTRMVPIEKVFNGLPLLARDLMRITGKEVDLQIYGKETELDKSLIEEINDPLIHLIRNAFDHGIESPETRRKLGKPPKGTVLVNAEQDGNYILITIEDDGQGMDVERIKQEAIEKGVITKDEAQELTTSEALNLIFIPGFTTKQEITNISGRGVGMDVVRTKIAKLKGIVDISSQIGKGTVITLKLPLTLAIIQGLLMKVGEETFAVPLNTVLEIVRLTPDEIYTIQGREVIRVRDTVLPLARMADVIGKPNSAKQPSMPYVVIVGWAEKRLGLLVDSLQGQREVVIKSLGTYLGDVPGIAGSTILGDGSVILIVDVGQFIELFARHFAKVA
jgi:two-component system chemotaxis sensor kinase CheA